MTNTFELVQVALNGTHKVESLDSWGTISFSYFITFFLYLQLMIFYADNKMYIGTSDGHVLLYVMQKQITTDGKTIFVSSPFISFFFSFLF